MDHIDDVAIAKILSNTYSLISLWSIQSISDSVFVIRYKSDNRQNDVINMKKDVQSKYI